MGIDLEQLTLEPLRFRVYVYRCAGCGKQTQHHHGGLTKCYKCAGQLTRVAQVSLKVEGLEIKVEAGHDDEAV